MKIMHLISGGDVGGAKTHVLSLLCGLGKTQTVRLVCFTDGPFADDARKLGIDTLVMDCGVPESVRRLSRMISAEGFEIVHCHGARANMMGAILRRKIRVPTVTTVHSDYRLDYLGRPLHRLTYGTINTVALRLFDYHIGVSDAVAQMLISRGFDPQTMFSIYNGVDFTPVEPAMSREEFLRSVGLTLEPDSVVFGIAARLSPVKDIGMLIRAFSIAQKSCPSIRLVIAGEGEEREKLEAEYEELEKRIAYYRELLSNEEMLKGVLKDELVAIRDKYGDDRLTEIQDVEDEIDIEDLIEEEQCVFTLSHAGYCKRVPASTYRSQKRGGRGVTGMTTKEEDFVEGVFTASTHDYILFFTNLGKVHRRKGYQIPEAGRTAKGTNLVNILPFEPGEKVTAGITVHEFDEDYLVFVTKNGPVKRLELASLNTARKAGIRALTLSDGDELIAVMKTDGKQDIMLASADGMAICFNENDVRVMGRDAAGVRGMALDAGDSIVGAGIAAKGKQLLSVTEYGYGKRTDIEEYMRLGDDGVRRPQQRGGKGLKNYNITAKTGRIAGVAIVDDEDDVMLIENGGVLIRMAAADINVYKRDTQGVILMRVEAGNRVISVDRVDREPEETADEHEEA